MGLTRDLNLLLLVWIVQDEVEVLFCFVASSVRIWESGTWWALIVERRTAVQKIDGSSSERNNTQGLEISENELPLQRHLQTVRRYICKIPFQKL